MKLNKLSKKILLFIIIVALLGLAPFAFPKKTTAGGFYTLFFPGAPLEQALIIDGFTCWIDVIWICSGSVDCAPGSWDSANCRRCSPSGQWENTCADWGDGQANPDAWCACELKCNGNNNICGPAVITCEGPYCGNTCTDGHGSDPSIVWWVWSDGEVHGRPCCEVFCGGWSSCSVSCGTGTQTRSCDGGANGYCAVTQTCDNGACPPSCTPSCDACSVSCGGGTQSCTAADCSTYSQACYAGACVCAPANSGCAASTCVGSSCWDDCSWIAGTKDCTAPTCGSLPPGSYAWCSGDGSTASFNGELHLVASSGNCSSANCEYYALPVASGCGSANGKTYCQQPTSNLCNPDNDPEVSANGSKWEWTCGSDSCTALKSCAYQEVSPN